MATHALRTTIKVDFSPASVGNNVIVASLAGYNALIIGAVLSAAGATVIKFVSETTLSVASDLTGPIHLAANGTLVLGNEQPLEVGLGTALKLNSSAGVNIGGWVVLQYITSRT